MELENSSMTCEHPDGIQGFAHDSLGIALKAHAEHINSGKLDLEKLWQEEWSYQEDTELWELNPQKRGIWRAAKPEMRKLIILIGGMLEASKAELLVKIVKRAHEALEQTRGITIYNPFMADEGLANEITRVHPELKERKIEDLLNQYDWATQFQPKIPTRTQAVKAQISPVRQLYWYGYRGELLDDSIGALNPYVDAYLMESAFSNFVMEFESIAPPFRQRWHSAMNNAISQRKEQDMFTYWKDSEYVFALLSSFPYQDRQVSQYVQKGMAESLVNRFRKRIETIDSHIFELTESQFPKLQEQLVEWVIESAHAFESKGDNIRFPYPLAGFGVSNIPQLSSYDQPEDPAEALRRFKKKHGLESNQKEHLYALHEYWKARR